MTTQAKLAKGSKVEQRERFWRYCVYANHGAASRSRKTGLPFLIDAYFLDALMVDQGWRCAVSGIALVPAGEREAFGPSLDRIVPELGYVPGNLRIVCNMVNCALNTWGESAFRTLIASIKEQ